MTDWELVRKFGATRSHDAFAELVRRHADWVYGVARRAVRGDRQLAEDVTQAVFLVLHRKAGALREGTVVTPWLFRVTRLAAAETLRREARRRRRERVAAMQRHERSDAAGGARTAATWDDVAPLLDRTIERLRGDDRRAITLRFFGGKSFDEVGRELGVSGDAARKRVARALGRMREMLVAKRSDVALSVGALHALLAANAVSPAPPALAAGILSAVGGELGAGTSAASLEANVIHAMFWSKGKLAAAVTLAATVLIGCAAGVHHRVSKPAPPTTSELTDDTAATMLNAAINAIAHAEQTVRTVYVKDFASVTEELPPGQTDWRTTPTRYAGSAWFDMGDGRSPYGWAKARTYLDPWVMRWVGSTADYADTPMDLSFDGAQGVEIRLGAGVPGDKRHVDRVAMVTATPPVVVDNPVMARTTGLAYALWWTPTAGSADPTAPKRREPPASETLAAALREGRRPEVGRETVNGVTDAVRIRWRTASAATDLAGAGVTYWLDPRRGFSLIRRETVVPGVKGLDVERVDVTELKEVAPGVWYPTAAVADETDDSRPGYRTRERYRAASVTVNDPQFGPAIFSPKIPAGYVVGDVRKAQRTDYIVMPDGSPHTLRTGDALPSVKPEEAHRPG